MASHNRTILQFIMKNIPILIVLFFNKLVLISADSRCPDQLMEIPYNCNKTYSFRSYDGTCNNLINAGWGSKKTCVTRMLPQDFGKEKDGSIALGYTVSKRVSNQNGAELPNERDLSNRLFKQQLVDQSTVTDKEYSHLLMEYGYFVAMDISHIVEPHRYPYSYILTTKNKGLSQFPCCMLRPDTPFPEYCAPINVASNDEFYSKFNYNCMNVFRSLPCEQCDGLGLAREQNTHISSFIDLNMIYADVNDYNKRLRTLDGGMLVVSKDVNQKCGLLPTRSGMPSALDTNEMCTSCPASKCRFDQPCFYTGDSVRNSHPPLTALTTIFVRHHNRIAAKLREINTKWDDERLFQETRKIVIAQHQAIIYGQYLPIILGDKKMTEYKLYLSPSGKTTNYDPTVDPRVLNEFGTAAFRFGHSNIQGTIWKVKADGSRSEVNLRDVYSNPKDIFLGQIDDYLRGLTRQPQATSDPAFTDDVRNYLERMNNGSYGMDLVAINIARGREHGLQPYLNYLKECVPSVLPSWIGTPNFSTASLRTYLDFNAYPILRALYQVVQDVDLYVGGMLEKKLTGAQVGETFACIIGKQFAALKTGDRFYFEHEQQRSLIGFTNVQLDQIRKTTLAGIICQNADDIKEIQDQPFKILSDSNKLKPCAAQYDIVNNLGDWRDWLAEYMSG